MEDKAPVAEESAEPVAAPVLAELGAGLEEMTAEPVPTRPKRRRVPKEFWDNSVRKRAFYFTKLTRARLKKGWTRTVLAQQCNLHYSTISRMESGEHQNPETVRLVAEKLGVSMDEIVVAEECLR